MAKSKHETRYRVVGRIAKGANSKGEVEPLPAPYETKHRPGPGNTYTIIGPDRELAVENCRKCRRPAAIVDNRKTKV